jgi:hypothetical protein
VVIQLGFWYVRLCFPNIDFVCEMILSDVRLLAAFTLSLDEAFATHSTPAELVRICAARKSKRKPIDELCLVGVKNITARDVDTLKSFVDTIEWDGVEK